jgi:hypothetical protein
MPFDPAVHSAKAIALANLTLTIMLVQKMAASGSFPKEEFGEAVEFVTLTMEEAAPAGPDMIEVCAILSGVRDLVLKGPPNPEPA